MHIYKVVNLIPPASNNDLETELNKYAQEGWELFTIVRDISFVQIVFKKAKE